MVTPSTPYIAINLNSCTELKRKAFLLMIAITTNKTNQARVTRNCDSRAGSIFVSSRIFETVPLKPHSNAAIKYRPYPIRCLESDLATFTYKTALYKSIVFAAIESHAKSFAARNLPALPIAFASLFEITLFNAVANRNSKSETSSGV